MADDNDVEVGEGAVEAPKSKSKLIMIVAAVLVLGGGAAAFFVMQGGGAAQAAEGADAEKLGKLMPIESFIVNLNESKSTRYLKITFSVELASDEYENEIRDRKDIIRDRCLTYLSGLSVDDVRGSETKPVIKQALAQAIDDGLNADGAIKNVLLTEFVVQ